MEEFNKNIVRDSNIHVEGDFYIGDTYNAPEDEPFKCFNCETPLDDARNQRTELGIVCHFCHELNFNRPANRTAIGGKFQHMKPEHEQDYAFLINEIEVNLQKRSEKANGDALKLAEKAIEMSLRTPDAYLFKALCLYYLSKPRWKLVQNNAEEVLSPIGTARRINEQYKLLQIIAGVIAGRYFRFLKFNLERLLVQLQTNRPAYDAVRVSQSKSASTATRQLFYSASASNPNQVRLAPTIARQEDIQRVLAQFAVCYEIYPNPLFLRVELDYLSGNVKDMPPMLELGINGLQEVVLDDLSSLRRCLLALRAGQFSAFLGREVMDEEIQMKKNRLQQLDRNWKAPALRLYSPFSERALTIDETITNIESRIAELERIAEQERIRQEEERRRQMAADKKEQETQRFYAILTGVGAVVLAWLAAWLIGMAYTEMSDNSYSIGQSFAALFKIPIAIAALVVGIVLFIVCWVLEALCGLLGWRWNWSSGIIDWAWNDVFEGWLWKPTNGIYLFAGAVMLYILYRMLKSAARRWR